jgi:hypothetical protein
VDRFIWAVVGGVVILSAVAVASILFARGAQAPPDLATPEGVATAYVLAVQSKQSDQAWDLLDSPEVAGISRPRGASPTQEDFRREVNNVFHDPNKRIRVLEATRTGDTARVDLEVTHVSQGPILFGGGSRSRTLSLSLRQRGDSWRITAAPGLWELG